MNEGESQAGLAGAAGGLSPKCLAGAVGPSAVVVFAADAVFAHSGENLAGARESFWILMFGGIPQVGTDDGASALEIDGFNGDDDDGARGFAIDCEGSQQIGIGGEMGAAIDAEGV